MEVKDSVRQFGVFISYNFNDHNPNFAKLPGIPNCCKGFTNGVGEGISAGAFVEMPLPFKLYAGLRLAYSQLDGWLREKEQTYLRDGNQVIEGIFEHNIKSNISTLGLEPYFRFMPIGNLSIFFGGRISIPLISKFHQWEQIIEPKDKGVFYDTQSRVRNDTAGKIPKSKHVQSDLHFGISFDLPLNKYKNFILTPFVAYHVGSSDLADSIYWRANSIRFGLALKYLPIKIKRPKQITPLEEFKKVIKIDTLLIENETVRKSGFAIGRERKDTLVERSNEKIVRTEYIFRTDTLFRKPKPLALIEINTGTIHLETQFVTHAFPLLPIIFFEKDSWAITDFYNKLKDPQDYDFDNLPTNPLELNREILNIVGYRLRNNPNSKITVIGYSDLRTENANCELARRRAEEVKNYLTSVWKIESNRIQIQTAKEKCFPSNSTVTQNDSGYAENRRVQITSNDPEILQPISKKRYLELLDFDPKVLKFDPKNSKFYGANKWSLEVVSDNQKILEYSGSGAPNEISEEVDENLIGIFQNKRTLEVLFKIEDDEGNISIDRKEIKVLNDTNEVEIQRLSLILFDVASSRIPPSAKNEIKKFLTMNSELTQARIIGYSDILGDRDYNYSLSQERATKTLEFVKLIDPKIEIIEIKGIGSSTLPPGINSYDTPAERFLSRTVYIELIKKWK
ncbi:MAG: OmpA family protein [Candidatus Kapaibacteriota bacterium]